VPVIHTNACLLLWCVVVVVVAVVVQESWYEFRVMAVMDDLISDSSNVVGVSSTG